MNLTRIFVVILMGTTILSVVRLHRYKTKLRLFEIFLIGLTKECNCPKCKEKRGEVNE